MIIQFKDLSEENISELWRSGAKRDGWPKGFVTPSDLKQYIHTTNQERIFTRGEMKGVWQKNRLAGFTTLNEIEPGFIQPGVDVFEGGTFLLPEFRGLGINEAIKQHLVSTAFRSYGATWCIFCISMENKRAIRAMDKLTLSFQRITISDVSHPLHRYLKWKSWKTGGRFILYAMMHNKYT